MKIDLNISDILTLPNKILAALTLASGLVLFLPTSILESLYMVGLRENYGFIISLVFIISFSLLVINSIYTIGKYIKSKRIRKKFYDEAEDRLRKLNEYQKAIIYLLYSQKNFTHPLPLHDGAIRMLETNMMIGKATSQYMVTDLNNAFFPYLLQPWVIQELDNNPNLLNDFKSTFQEKI